MQAWPNSQRTKRLLRMRVEADHRGEFVALDIETGAWKLDGDALAACERLLARKSDSQTWLVRVGYLYLHRIGGPRRVLEPL